MTVAGETQQSSDMVERVARRLAQKYIRFAQGSATHEQINAQWHFYKDDAETALEASHHTELVEALRTLATFDFGTRASIRKYAAEVLAKIGERS